MNFFLQLALLANFVLSISAQRNYEEAKRVIQDYVRSYDRGVGKDMCDKYTCCTMSGSQSCSISNFQRDSSTLVLPGGNTRCIFSDSTPYAFQVRVVYCIKISR
jgi:hypothetical protein